MNDLNQQIFMLKTKIQQDMSEANLPISVVSLVLDTLGNEVKSAENEYFKFLMQKEKENKEKEEQPKETE